MTTDVKENRTLAALSNLLGCRVEEILGDLPPLGEAGEVRLPYRDSVSR
jgi:hypothetical protein